MTDSSQPAATLTISRGPDAGRRFDIGAAPVTIGRHEQCNIQVPDRWMSRQHARIAWTGSGYAIEDLGSTNGTFVSGERVTGSRALKSGDHLRLGEEVELAFWVSEPVARPEARALSGAGELQPAPGPVKKESFLRRKSTRVWGLALLGLLLVLLVGGGVYYLLTSEGQPEDGTPAAAADAAGALPGPTTETEAASPTPMFTIAQADATLVGPMTISSRGTNASAEGGEIEFSTSADGTALVSMSYSFVEGKCTYVSGSSTTTVTGGSKSTLFFVEPVPITNGRFSVDFMGVRAEGTFTSPSEASGEVTIDQEEMMSSPPYEKFVCEYGTWTWTAAEPEAGAPTEATPPTHTPTATPTRVPPTATPRPEPLVFEGEAFEADVQGTCSTDVAITEVVGDALRIEVLSGTISIREGGLTIWCYGAKHTWIGTLTYGGYTFESDEDDPLQFILDRNKGYTYLAGKGRVTQPDGRSVELPQ